MNRWVSFCEADADFRTASRLIDEVLRLRGAPWVAEELDREPANVRQWHEGQPGRSWFDVHSVYHLAKRLSVQLSYGHFDGHENVRRRLATRGEGCGLEAYLTAVEKRLLPLVDPAARSE